MSAIYYHEYCLRSRVPLNAQSDRREFYGVLLRIGDGFACLHPWPELGDAPLAEQLECLREARPTRLIARAYRCAGLDALARREGRSLFAGLKIPESHALIPGGGVEEAMEEGFATVKLKCGERIGEEGERVAEIAARGEKRGLRLRLDFNESLREEGFRELMESLPEAAKAQIEFVEDPAPYDGAVWERMGKESGLALALDRQAGEGTTGYQYLVIKPALDDVEALLAGAKAGGIRVVITSYMDHPLGQIYAAYEAARAGAESDVALETCGLLTHRLFEPDAFVEQIVSEGPRLRAPGGTGLGFDDLLESLSWKKLI